MAADKSRRFSKNARIGMSILIVAVVVMIAVGVTTALLPRFAEVDYSKAPQVVAIIPTNNNEISADADLRNVYVQIKYSDGSDKTVELSELTIAGLNTENIGVFENVELVYGGFKQYVTYKVVPTKLKLRYLTPSGGGRIEGLKEQEIDAGKDASTVRAIPDEGFVFVRWSDGILNPIRTDRAVKKNEDIIATFSRKILTVVFQYPDGTLTREHKIEYGKSAASFAPRLEENQMKLYGYKFSHWNKDFTRVTENMTLLPTYVKHAANFHLSITTRDGERLGKIEQPDKFHDIALPYFQKEEIAILRLKSAGGRLFTGWSIRDYLGNWHDLPVSRSDEENRIKVEVASGEQGYVDFISSSTGTMVDEYQLAFTPPLGVDDIYVKANLIYEESNLTFYSFGEPVVGDDGQQLSIALNNKLSTTVGVIEREYLGNKFDYQENILRVKGHIFKGWQYTHEGVTYNVTEDNYRYIQFDQDARLDAIWEVGTYDVIFRKDLNEDPDFVDPNKGYDAISECRILRVKYQNNLNNILEGNGVFPNAGIRENYTFVGWFTTKAEGAVSVSLNTVLDEEGLVVYPVFEVNKINLDIETLGSGSAHVKLQDSLGDWYLGPEILSRIQLDVVSSHIISFVANENYYISSLKVNGDLVSTPVGATSYDLIFSSPLEDRLVEVSYTMFNTAINLTNGDAGIKGRVEYLNDIDYGGSGAGVGEIVVITGETAVIPSQINSRKILAITAPENYSIYRILVNSQEVPNLPAGAKNYKLEVVTTASDTSVSITYQRIQHLVQVVTPSEQMQGGIISVREDNSDRGHSARFNKGAENVSIFVDASLGYYIKTVRVNGYILNPYADHATAQYLGNNIKVNYVDANLEKVDPRVSSISYQIRKIEQDLAIDVEYATMYYTIQKSTIGQGSVQGVDTALYGSKAYVNGQTTDNNYVLKVYVNNMIFTPSTNSSAYTHIIDSITEDYNIKFEFAPKTYGVTFYPNDLLKVYYSENYYPLSNGHTFEKLQRGLSLNFKVISDEKFELATILYKLRGTNDWNAMPIPYNVSEFDIRIDNLENSYEYKITVEQKKSSYVIKPITGQVAPTVTVNDELVTFGSYEYLYPGSINYGTQLNLEVYSGAGYRVPGFEGLDLPADLSFVKILNLTDITKEYQYYVYGQSMPEGPCYTIYRESGDVGYELYIDNIASNLEIILAFEKNGLGATPNYTIDFQPTYYVSGNSGEEKGTIRAYHSLTSDNPVEVLAGNSVPPDSNNEGVATIEYRITPENGYVVKSIIVNGIVIANYSFEEAELVAQRIIRYALAKDQDVEVIFAKKRSKITFVQNEDTKGAISSNLEFYEENNTVSVRVTPRIGYEIDSIIITQLVESGGSEVINKGTIDSNEDYQETGVYEFKIGASGVIASDYLKYNLSVEARFIASRHTLSIRSTGQGSGTVQLFKGLDLVAHGLGTITSYDEIYSLRLTPLGDSYLKSIIVNGFEYDVASVVQNGAYNFRVTGDLDIEVKFERIEYFLRLHGSVNGRVKAKLEKENHSTPYKELHEVKLYSTDTFSIIGTANYGYNVKRLSINGIDVWTNTHPTLLYPSNEWISIGKVVDYIDGGRTIIDIEVEFAINSYSIQLRSENHSLNFKNIDRNPSDFGTIAISGRQINSSQLYVGFSHGSNVRVDLRPRVGRGYYISKFIIKYSDASLGEQDLTSHIINNEGDSYLIRNISCNIEHITVEYSRRTYTIDHFLNLYPLAEAAKFQFSGSSSEVNAYNPYDRNLEVYLNEGRYEFGLGYEISLNPGEGYERTSFEINGVDRMTSVRSNIFRGVVNGSIVAESLFSIKQFKIVLDYQVSEEGKIVVEDAETGSVIWSEDKLYDVETYNLSTGTVTTGYDVNINRAYLLVSYNTSLRYRVFPSFEESGFKISRILKGNQLINFSNAEVEYSFRDSSHSAFVFTVDFEKSKYEVRYVIRSGALESLVNISESQIEWGGLVNINIVIDRGSYLGLLSYSESLTDLDSARTIRTFSSQLTIDSIQGSYDAFPPQTDGKQHIFYTQANIKTPIMFIVGVMRNKYDIALEREYDIEHNHNGTNYQAGIHIKTNERNPNYSSNEYGTSVLDSLIKQTGGSGNNRALVRTRDIESRYIGLNNDDQVDILFTAPTGYDISTINISMQSAAGIIEVVSSTNDQNIIRQSLYKYLVSIPKAIGNIEISVTYKIRTYQLALDNPTNGAYTSNTTSGSISHHGEFEIEILADFGYRLESFLIFTANRYNQTAKAKDTGRYIYSTTISGIRARVVDAYTSKDTTVNAEGNYPILITSSFTSLKYDIEIYVKEIYGQNDEYKLITNPDLTMLKVELPNVQIIYDITYQGFRFTHNLKDGAEVVRLEFFNQNRNNQGVSLLDKYSLYRNYSTDVGLIDSYTSSNPSQATLETIANNLLDVLDFHNSSKNKIFLYYDVAMKEFEVKTYFRYIQSSGSETLGYTSFGSDVSVVPNANISINSSDNLPISPITNENLNGTIHTYGTNIRYNVSVSAANSKKIQFAGFQEEVNGVWRYIPISSGLIEGTGNNQILTINVKSEKTIRAVFYQVFVVNVVIMPSYQTTGSPTLNNFVRYESSLIAQARYDKTEAQNRTLPYVANPLSPSSNEYLEEEIQPINVGAHKVNYEFLVKSGAKLRLSARSTLNVDFYIVKNNSQGFEETQEDKFKIVQQGYDVNTSMTVNAHTNKPAFALVSRTTLGGEASEGGKIEYRIGSGALTNYTSSYIQVANNNTLVLEISVNRNYRFDSITYKIPSEQPSPEGKLIFGVDQELVTGDDQKRTTVRYQDAYGASLDKPANPSEKQRVRKIIVTITNYSIHKAISVKFVKQIRVFKYAFLFRDNPSDPTIPTLDQSVREIDAAADRIFFGPQSTNQNHYYDYNDELQYGLIGNYTQTLSDELGRPLQFVGFSINGINFEKNLGSGYPNPSNITSIILNDLDRTLENGVSFVYENNNFSGNNPEYVVKIAARFVPLINILVENDYESSPGEYVDTGNISISTVQYNASVLEMDKSLEIVESQYIDSGTSTTVYTNKLLKVPGKINSSLNSVESGYHEWKDNIVTLNWLSESDRRTIAFIHWEYFAYNPNHPNKGEWIPIGYTQNIDGRTATSKDSVYSFPLSAILPEVRDGNNYYRPYYYYTKANGVLEQPIDYSGDIATFFGMQNIAKYDSAGAVIPGEFIPSIPVLRIRPKYERRVYLDIASYLASEEEGSYSIVNSNNPNSLINPSIGASGLTSQSLPLNTVALLRPNVIEENFIFEGWYFRAQKEIYYGQLEELDNVRDTVTVDTLGNEKTINYVYLKNASDIDVAIEKGLLSIDASYVDFDSYYKGCLVIKLDWPEGDYLIATKFTSLYEIVVSVVHESGSTTEILNKSRLHVDYYGIASKEDDNKWSAIQPLSTRIDEYTISLKVQAGKLALFKLNSPFIEGTTNPLNDFMFNPRYDQYAGIAVYANGNLSTNIWGAGPESDSRWSENVVSPGSADTRNLAKIRASNYAINANANKRVVISVRSFGALTIHNVLPNSQVKVPSDLSNALNLSGQLIQDNASGGLDKDDREGFIRIEDILIKKHFYIDGSEATDYGVKISPYLTGPKVLASQDFLHDITLDAENESLRKEQHVVIFETVTVDKWDQASDSVKQVNIGKNLERPFDSGTGDSDNPFVIMTPYQFLQIDSLYLGNDQTLHFLGNNAFHFKLGANIDLNDPDYPISSPLCATGVLGFNGVLDGNGKTLYGLDIVTTGVGAGLFKILTDGAVIKNVKIAAQTLSSYNGNTGFFAPNAEAMTSEIEISNITSSVLEPDHRLGDYSGNFVGSLIGKISTSPNSVLAKFILKDIDLSYASVLANALTFDQAYEDSLFTTGANPTLRSTNARAAAGGAIGFVDGRVDATDIVLRFVAVSSISNQYSRFAGGFIGIADTASSMLSTFSNISIHNPTVRVMKNFAGGMFGVLGRGQTLNNSSIHITGGSPEVNGAYGSVTGDVPDAELFKQACIGGAVGLNKGTINRFSYKGSQVYKLYAGVVGGVVGINEGSIYGAENFNMISGSTVKLRSEIIIQSAGLERLCGGIFGGLIGWNKALGRADDISISNTSYTNYSTLFGANSAYYEVAYDAGFSNNLENYRVHSDLGVRTPNGEVGTVFAAGMVGYNSANSIDNLSALHFGTKLILYREIDGSLGCKTYLNAISNKTYSRESTFSGRVEYSKLIMADNKNPDDASTEIKIPPIRNESIDTVGVGDPSSGGGYTMVRYLTLGSYYVRGQSAKDLPPGRRPRIHSTGYSTSRSKLRRRGSAIGDEIVCDMTIAPTGSGFAINYNSENLAEGKVVTADGSGINKAYNYIGYIRQSIVSREDVP